MSWAANDPLVLAERVDEGTGWQLIAYRMLLGNVRLMVCEPGSGFIEKGWCYQRPAQQDALDAVHSWNGEGTPPGRWYKDLQSGETRPAYCWTGVRPVAH